MRWAFAAAAGLACLAAWVSPGQAAVATGAPIGVGQPATGLFSVEDLLNGKAMTLTDCRAIDMAVWVSADGASECLRYYLSAVPGDQEAVVLLHGDFVDADLGKPAKVAAADYGETGAADELNDAATLAGRLGHTVVVLARPGTFGSSGNELQTRHSVHEARLVNAALDAIAARYRIRRFHLVGQSGGAILVGALVAMRADVGCAVIGSGRLALAPYAAGPADLATAQAEALLDDQAYVEAIRPSPWLRPFVLSDPADTRSAIAGQTRFVLRALMAGVPLHQILTVSDVDDGAHHDLLGQALRVTQECVAGASAAHIRDVVQRFAHDNARAWAQQSRRQQAAMTLSSDAAASVSGAPEPAR